MGGEDRTGGKRRELMSSSCHLVVSDEDKHILKYSRVVILYRKKLSLFKLEYCLLYLLACRWQGEGTQVRPKPVILMTGVAHSVNATGRYFVLLHRCRAVSRSLLARVGGGID